MELVRRKSDYALRSLAYMAKLPYGKKFTINTIAERQNIPKAFLRKIFQRLSERHIVNSQKGPAGGFYLLKNPSRITLKDILESQQGRISLSDCLFGSRFCKRIKVCRVRKKLSRIQMKLDNLLAKSTLKEIA